MLKVKIGSNLSMTRHTVSTNMTIGDFLAEYGEAGKTYNIQGERVTAELMDMTFEEYHNGSIPEWTLILSVIKADNA